MKIEYKSVKTFSIRKKIEKTWQLLYSRLQHSSATDFKQHLEALNLFSLKHGIQKKIAVSFLGCIFTVGVQAQVVFTEPTTRIVPNSIKVAQRSAPAFIDLDKDNDLDLVIGEYTGEFNYYENDNGVFIQKTGTDNPFNGFDVGYSATPTFVDLDNDNDLDLVSGADNNKFKYYENNGGVFTELTGASNPLDNLFSGNLSAPDFGDVDNDNDLDLIAGNSQGEFSYYKNENGVFVVQSGVNNPFNNIDVGDAAAPRLVDLDGDNDLDLVSGEYYGFFKYYENNGGVFTELTGTNNPLNGFTTDNRYAQTGYSTPVFADLDGDSDLDMVSGGTWGFLVEFHNGDIATGIDAEIKQKSNIFPNPADNQIQVEDIGDYQIFDILGNQIAAGRTNGKSLIDITNFDSGQYFLKSKNGVQSFVKTER